MRSTFRTSLGLLTRRIMSGIQETMLTRVLASSFLLATSFSCRVLAAEPPAPSGLPDEAKITNGRIEAPSSSVQFAQNNTGSTTGGGATGTTTGGASSDGAAASGSTASTPDTQIPTKQPDDIVPPPSSIQQNYVPDAGLPGASDKVQSPQPTASESLLSEEERKLPKTLPVSKVPEKELIPIAGGRLPPIRLEARYDQPVGLKDVLTIALQNNLPIQISRAGYDSQRYLFYGALGRFLPDNNLIYRVQQLYTEGNYPVDTSTLSNTVRFPVFQGGRVLFGSLVALYRMRTERYRYGTTINDTLLEVYNRYYNLLLQQILLQIRLKSVEVSRAQLRLNEQLRAAGTGTNFAVMQSMTQLALDKQNLLTQQVAVRQASLQLALSLNLSVAANFIPAQAQVTETRLVDPSLSIDQITDVALRNRPELKQLNNNRLAQSRQVVVTAAPLLPTMQFFISANRTETLRRGATQNNNNANSAVAVSGGGNLGTQVGTGFAGTGAGGSIVQGVGATGIGGVNSAVVVPGGGGTGLVVGATANQSVTAGFDITWNLSGLGVPDAMATMAQKALARQAMLQYNQQVITVLQQVRQSYLNSLTAEEQVDVTGEGVVASQEGLRLANLRIQHGVGTNLELIQAQRDYITALINQAQAIINFNLAQAQLIRDMGIISVETLTAQQKRPIGADPIKFKYY